MNITATNTCRNITASNTCMNITASHMCMNITVSNVCMRVTAYSMCMNITVSNTFMNIRSRFERAKCLKFATRNTTAFVEFVFSKCYEPTSDIEVPFRAQSSSDCAQEAHQAPEKHKKLTVREPGGLHRHSQRLTTPKKVCLCTYQYAYISA